MESVTDWLDRLIIIGMCSLLSVPDCLLTLSDSFCRFNGTLHSPLDESFWIRGSLISGMAGTSPFLWACGDLCSKKFGCRPLGEEPEGGSGKNAGGVDLVLDLPRLCRGSGVVPCAFWPPSRTCRPTAPGQHIRIWNLSPPSPTA